jgi:hypothetical protein
MKPTRLFSFFPRLGAMLLLAGTTLSADERPNIVILYVDDMGYGDLGANNPASKILTPHLDKLAAEGMRFTDAHSSSGVCTPSRYALLMTEGRASYRTLCLPFFPRPGSPPP